jgi:chemotaxis protein methyltransferase CheR
MTSPDSGNVGVFRSLVARRFGLDFDDSKRDFLEDILRKRTDAGGHGTPEAYLRDLEAKGGAKEFSSLADALTVNETFFYRNIDHFRALIETALPERIRLRGRERKLRLLSAGCASGEEAYTIAMVIHDRFPELQSWKIEIRAVDVNTTVLAAAADGLFSPWSLRGTEPSIRDRHFSPESGKFRIARNIRSMVSFEKRNLAEANLDLLHPGAGFDVIFCRNVIMYFLPETAAGLIARMSASLSPGGYLFLGHAETLRGLSHDFHLRHTHGTFYYQRMDGAPATDTPSQSAAWMDADASVSEEAQAVPWEPSGTWVEIIQRASEKIAGLADRSGGPSPAYPAAAGTRPHAWNRALAMDLLRGERFSEALEVLRQLPPESAGDPDALLLRAVLLTNMGERAESEAVCRRLLGIDELNAGAHYLMALCREHAGDAAAAEEHDRTAIYLDAVFAMPWLHLGLLAKRNGRSGEARLNLEQALTLLAKEDSSRILLFGGGFGREALAQLCRSGLRTLEGS